MRRLIDFLARFVEPYVSFRWLVALIFAGIAVNAIIATLLTLHDLSIPTADAGRRERCMLRIARTFALLLLLRTCSIRGLGRHVGQLVVIALLVAAAVGLNWYVYSQP